MNATLDTDTLTAVSSAPWEVVRMMRLSSGQWEEAGVDADGCPQAMAEKIRDDENLMHERCDGVTFVARPMAQGQDGTR